MPGLLEKPLQGEETEYPVTDTAQRTLQLMARQLRGAVSDAQNDMDDMVRSFLNLYELAAEIEKLLPEDMAASLNGCIGQVMGDMQFFDAMSQRIEHVASALNRASRQRESLSSVVAGLGEELKSAYTTAAERMIHEQNMSGDNDVAGSD